MFKNKTCTFLPSCIVHLLTLVFLPGCSGGGSDAGVAPIRTGLDAAQFIISKSYFSSRIGAGCSWVILCPELSGGVRVKAQLFCALERCSKYPKYVVSWALWLLSRKKFYAGGKQLGPHTLHFARHGI